MQVQENKEPDFPKLLPHPTAPTRAMETSFPLPAAELLYPCSLGDFSIVFLIMLLETE